ncbi:MAG: PilZ domain-containing protein [Deltaproteobacteria bacterium]|nr:PilZ domain-containing protein [Nannocystaceae bacterium]
MPRHPSSLSIPRMDDEGPRAPRRLRLRGDEQLAQMLVPGLGGSEAARLETPSREPVAIGDQVAIEVGFGALVDEVELAGTVVEVRARASGLAPLVVIAIDPRSAVQLAYIDGCIRGDRQASVRAHRRIVVDTPVRWRAGELMQQTRARDLSRGGAFILSHLQPTVGTEVSIELDGTATTPNLRIAAVVSWIQRTGPLAGFGVRFSVRTRGEAARLQQLVRVHERGAEQHAR